MGLAELVAGAARAAYLDDVLKEAGILGKAAILTYSAQISPVRESETGGVGGAGDNSSREEDEGYLEKHYAIVLSFSGVCLAKG